MRRERLVAVGYLGGGHVPAWQSPDQPAPSILAYGPRPTSPQDIEATGLCGQGWLLVEVYDDGGPQDESSTVEGEEVATWPGT